MQFGRGSRKSIRYSIFIGVLAGSVFSGSGAYAAIEISTQSGLEAIDSSLNENYVLLNDIVLEGTPTAVYSYVAGSFLGTFDGNSKTISGLSVPLFDIIGGDGSTSVSNLVLETSFAGVSGNGALANSASIGTTIENIQVTGDVVGTSNNVGGLVGSTGSGVIITESSAVGDVTGIGNYVGGLVGSSGGDISDSHSSGSVIASSGTYVGGLVGGSSGNITNSYSASTVSGATIIGGLVGEISGDISNSYVNAQGEITGTGDYVGGLAGYSTGNILDSYAIIEGGVSGNNIVGGLAGYANGVARTYSNVAVDGNNSVGGLVGEAHVLVNNSYSEGSVTGNSLVGGLVGDHYGNITNSYATGSVTGVDRVGGLVGWSDVIANSYATGSVVGEVKVGGLAGLSEGDISNSYATGNVNGEQSVGGLVGEINYNSTVTESYATGNIIGTTQNIGSFAGYVYGDVLRSYSLGTVGGTGTHLGGFAGDADTGFSWIDDSCAGSLVGVSFNCTDGRTVDSDFILGEIGTESGVGNLGADFDSSNECLNGGNPYLVALTNSYESSCTGGGGTPPPTRRERIEREFREVLETRTPEKIEKLDGFKKEVTVTKDAAIAFVEPTEKIEVAKVKAVEVSATANVRVNAKTDEALQISFKSESKEPVELWVKSPDGKWLLAGVITFDKDGKAILPPLKFKNVGNYSLVLSKPTADSAKGSAPLNQTGSLLVAVS
jgi:hypothetical protein